jgi:hypothetical protein
MVSTLPKGTLGCDYSMARPGGAAIAAAGYRFVLRYLSYQPEKNISPPELADLHSHGLYVGFVWETTGTSILGGAGTGAVEGAAARSILEECGVPADVPIFVALDEDDRGVFGWQGSIREYLVAFAHASGHMAIPYGSNRVIDFFESGWQTEAWSTEISRFAALYQRAGSQTQAYHSFPPNTLDEDVLLADQAIFFAPGPPPAPTPAPVPIPSGDTVLYPGNVNAHGPLNFAHPTVVRLQALLYANGLLIAPRNVLHSVLIAAINRVQEINGWPMTGVADERVWAWCLRREP